MPTRCLFYDNAYLTQFEATLLDWQIHQQFIEVTLDQTAFYPTSGGQPHDTGTLNGLPVSNVFWQDKDIIHNLPKQYHNEIKQWDCIKGQIDWNRRFDHMQHHTGQHILSRSFMEIIPGAETVSFHLTESSSHIDVSIPTIHDSELTRILKHANSLIFQNVDIKTYFTSKEEAAKKNLRKGVETITNDQVRIVEIGNYDIDPCGGTHLNRTGEIGLILIEDVKKAGKRGNRIRFVCGWRAINIFTQQNQILKNIQELLKSELQDLPELVQHLQNTLREKDKTNRTLQSQLQAFEIDQFINDANATSSRVISHIFEDSDPETVKQLALGIVEADSKLIPIFGIRGDPSFMVMARSDQVTNINLNEVLKEGLTAFKGRGGGTETLVQAGGIANLPGLLTALEVLIQQKI